MPVLDPEGAHLAALRRPGDARFAGPRARELGCGARRLTLGVATDVAYVFAFDPDADAIARARDALPELAERVTYKVASATQIGFEPHSSDLAVFSWSL